MYGYNDHEYVIQNSKIQKCCGMFLKSRLQLSHCRWLSFPKIVFFVSFQTIADIIRTCLGPRAMMKVSNEGILLCLCFD